ncbi:dithiobiotin synthetase [Sulfuricaulis limicola]|uniref:ATP-dependent dethiobiotin synthetase BioD n=1 Tax=Sulfuricaulis limicola TaxID=1620215 RepID=A0A1B4XD32_9GAMM|nr:dethiobiotin synthase [Sulfuricaulis limicola]BAV32724.1 dithiobiotin synthetase [Sulfuricaulis limicola]
MSGGWFVSGTDTGVGKTLVSRLLLEALKHAGHPAAGMKPVASGCHVTAAGLRSDDALELMQASGAAADYADVNPYALRSACAPHIAAQEMGVAIRLEKILESFRRLQEKSPWVVVEGVGGWMVPLGEQLTMAEVARALSLPVILVVGLRLGCLNHALLTVEAIRRADIPLAGWVANRIDPAMTHVPENIAALAQKIEAPLLAQIPYQSAAKPDVAAAVFPVAEMIMRFN